MEVNEVYLHFDCVDKAISPNAAIHKDFVITGTHAFTDTGRYGTMSFNPNVQTGVSTPVLDDASSIRSWGVLKLGYNDLLLHNEEGHGIYIQMIFRHSLIKSTGSVLTAGIRIAGGLPALAPDVNQVKVVNLENGLSEIQPNFPPEVFRYLLFNHLSTAITLLGLDQESFRKVKTINVNSATHAKCGWGSKQERIAKVLNSGSDTITYLEAERDELLLLTGRALSQLQKITKDLFGVTNINLQYYHKYQKMVGEIY